MPEAEHPPTTVNHGTVAFLCGLCETEELPGTFLIEVLGALGMSASGARSHLARAVGDGRLTTRRVGRRTFYRLSGLYLRRYREVKSKFDAPPIWAGCFHIVIYEVPETRRAERDALRTAAFEEGWASPRPGVLLGMRPPGTWAHNPSCFSGVLKVDVATARDLAASAWPLAEAAEQIRRLSAQLKGGQTPTLTASNESRTALLNQVASAHTLLRQATYLWGSLPSLPDELLPADYPHDLLAQITAEMNGPMMVAGAQAAQKLLALHTHAPAPARLTAGSTVGSDDGGHRTKPVAQSGS